MSARWTDPQIRTGQAHLFDLAALNARQGRSEVPKMIARLAAEMFGAQAEAMYREGLRVAGVAPADIDAAESAILDGKVPPGSLVAEVKKMRDRTENDAEDLDAERAHGRLDAYEHVLELLGAAPSKEPR